MAQITCKELDALSDLLNMEQNLASKFDYYAQISDDTAVKAKFEALAQTHQKRFDELYANLH